MALSRRRFFAGLVGALGAVVGLKAVRAAPLEDWTVETEVGPFFQSLAQEKADLAAMSGMGMYDPPASGKAIMALQERAYRDFAEMDRAQAYRYYAYAAWQPMLPPPPEIRDMVKLRDYMNEQIRDHLTRIPPPMVFSRESLEAAGVQFNDQIAPRRRYEGIVRAIPGPGPEWLNP